MDSTLAYWLRWPSLEYLITTYTWMWPLCEILHFTGLILLFAAVGSFDLRLLGLARGIPPRLIDRLIPWGIFGFVLCVATGFVFVGGIVANVNMHPYEVLTTNIWLQLKLSFIGLAGLNLLAYYASGMARKVAQLEAGEDTPRLAKVFALASLALWLGVVYFGRLIPWDL